MSVVFASDAELIALLIDGDAPIDVQEELARRIAERPELGKLVRRHLLISEALHQQMSPERSAEAFTAGWQVRLDAEQDGAVFTAQVMLRAIDREAERRQERFITLVRVGSLAAAACLMLGFAQLVGAAARQGDAWIERSGLASSPVFRREIQTIEGLP